MKKFTENPDAADDEDEKEMSKDQDDMGDEDSDDDNEKATGVPAADAFKKSKSKSTTPGDDDDDESDDSYWDSDSDESSRYTLLTTKFSFQLLFPSTLLFFGKMGKKTGIEWKELTTPFLSSYCHFVLHSKPMTMVLSEDKLAKTNKLLGLHSALLSE